MQVQQGTDQQKQAPGDKQTFPDSGESGASREKGQRNACGGKAGQRGPVWTRQPEGIESGGILQPDKPV